MKLEKKLVSDEYFIMQKRNKDTSENKMSHNFLWSEKILDTTAYLNWENETMNNT